MLCPLKNDGEGYFGHCDGSQCSWWVEAVQYTAEDEPYEVEECAVRRIGNVLLQQLWGVPNPFYQKNQKNS